MKMSHFHRSLTVANEPTHPRQSFADKLEGQVCAAVAEYN